MTGYLIFILFTLIRTFFYMPSNSQNNSRESESKILRLKSAVNSPLVVAGVISVTMATNFIMFSAFLYGAGIFLSFYLTEIGSLPVNMLTTIMEYIVHNGRRIIAGITSILDNPSISRASLIEIHAYLTPYIISQESIWFNLLIRILNYLESVNHPEFPNLERLFVEIREVANTLLELYRQIERNLGIFIEDSPISLQDVEN